MRSIAMPSVLFLKSICPLYVLAPPAKKTSTRIIIHFVLCTVALLYFQFCALRAISATRNTFTYLTYLIPAVLCTFCSIIFPLIVCMYVDSRQRKNFLSPPEAFLPEWKCLPYLFCRLDEQRQASLPLRLFQHSAIPWVAIKHGVLSRKLPILRQKIVYLCGIKNSQWKTSAWKNSIRNWVVAAPNHCAYVSHHSASTSLKW